MKVLYKIFQIYRRVNATLLMIHVHFNYQIYIDVRFTPNSPNIYFVRYKLVVTHAISYRDPLRASYTYLCEQPAMAKPSTRSRQRGFTATRAASVSITSDWSFLIKKLLFFVVLHCIGEKKSLNSSKVDCTQKWFGDCSEDMNLYRSEK